MPDFVMTQLKWHFPISQKASYKQHFCTNKNIKGEQGKVFDWDSQFLHCKCPIVVIELVSSVLFIILQLQRWFHFQYQNQHARYTKQKDQMKQRPIKKERKKSLRFSPKALYCLPFVKCLYFHKLHQSVCSCELGYCLMQHGTCLLWQARSRCSWERQHTHMKKRTLLFRKVAP